MSKQIAVNIMQPIVEFQKYVAEITRPLADFQKNIATVVAPLVEYRKVLSAIRILGENQFVFWSYMSKDYVSEILQSKDVNSLMLAYYTKNDLLQIKETIQECKCNVLIEPYTKLFSQSISAYNRRQYHLSIRFTWYC